MSHQDVTISFLREALQDAYGAIEKLTRERDHARDLACRYEAIIAQHQDSLAKLASS